MRVTDRLLFDTTKTATALARSRVQEAVAEASSGLRIRHAGDDPASTTMALRHSAAVKRYEAITRTTERATDELAVAESALGQVGNVLVRAKEIAVRVSTDIYDPSDRAAAAKEIDGLLQQAVKLANTDFGGRYVFAGTADDRPPFDAAGAYLGNSAERELELAPGVRSPVSVPGDVLLKGAAGGVDVMTTLSDLSAALSTNDVDAVRGSLPSLDQGLAQVTQSRSMLGATMNDLDMAIAASRQARDTAVTARSNEVEVDVVDAATRLALTQRALQAAYSATTRGFELSLLDRMR